MEAEKPKPKPKPETEQRKPHATHPGPSRPDPLANYPSFATLNKICQTGFGSADLAKAEEFKRNFKRKERLAELEAKRFQNIITRHREEIRDRLASTSSESSNYNTPPGSPAPPAAKAKGKLKKNLDQVTKALGFLFSRGENS